jgi:integrase
MKLSVRATEALKLASGERDRIVFDEVVPGWGIRLRESGKRYWIFQYSVPDATKKSKYATKRITFGQYPAMPVAAAREQAEKYHAQVKLGGDPQQGKADSKARSDETFEACLKLYLERRRTEGKLRASSYGEIERHLVKNLAPLHGLHIAKVDRRAIAFELGRLTNESPVQANRTRASLVKFLNWCAGEGFIESNPATFTNKNPEQTRDRVLSEAELRKIWHALPEGDFGDIIKLLALTGQRRDEIGQLRWDEVDHDRAVITLPPLRTKNGRQHTIPLAARARGILTARWERRDPDRALVFGVGQGGFNGWADCKRRLDDEIKLPHWVIHDLRRAVATGMNEIGTPPWVVEAVLNHASGHRAGVAGVYDRATYEAEKAVALARWDEHLLRAVERQASAEPCERLASLGGRR